MVLKLYNTLSRKKEVFKPIKKGEVGLYSCGPTVYWHQHIGNLKAYIFSDTLRRVLEYNDFKVKQIINITDVGHLTSDADTGEDKIEKAANKEGKSAKEVADYYFSEFEKDLNKLNVKSPAKWTKATEHIKEQINLIKKLEKSGYTYRTEDGIYYDSSKFKNYSKLGNLNIEGLRKGKRVKMGEKKNITDFALWKFSAGEKRLQEWDSPWGAGFPGWHIECSAMSMKYLGETFDIHTGGPEHVQVHHTNEIAQSEAATGKKYVNYWMHFAWLVSGGKKVSKSKGGLYTLSEIEKLGFSAMDFKYMMLTTHYRKPLEFSLDHLKAAQTSHQRLKNLISETPDDGKTNSKYLKEFEKAINDDLNTPNALQALWKMVRDEAAIGKIGAIKEMDKVFGLNLLEKEEIEIPNEVEELVKERQEARKNKDWKKADALREIIRKEGYEVDDTSNGTKVNLILNTTLK